MQKPPIVEGLKIVFKGNSLERVVQETINTCELLQRMLALFVELLYEMQSRIEALRLANGEVY